jgi:hypothetical protein
MSRLSKTNNLLETLPAESRSAITGLIDIKVDGDMDRVLSEIKTLKVEMTSQINAINSKIDSMEKTFDAKLDSMESKFDAKLDSMESKFDAKIDSMESRFKTLTWAIGISASLFIAAFVFIGTLLSNIQGKIILP